MVINPSINAENATTQTTQSNADESPATASNNKPASSSSSSKSLKTFISGGLAGSVAKTLVAPIDRAKILRQVHNHHYESYGIFESFYRIVQKEGFLALYKGNGAQMVRIFPYAAMQFTSYETYKNLNRKIFINTHDNLFNSLACGSLAGMTAVSTTYPLDVIRSRLAFQYTGEHIYSGIIDSVKKIYAVSFVFFLLQMALQNAQNLRPSLKRENGKWTNGKNTFFSSLFKKKTG